MQRHRPRVWTANLAGQKTKSEGPLRQQQTLRLRCDIYLVSLTLVLTISKKAFSHGDTGKLKATYLTAHYGLKVKKERLRGAQVLRFIE